MKIWFVVWESEISIQADVSAGSIIEVLGNVDNRNQIACDNIIAFEPEQTANFGKYQIFSFPIVIVD